MNYPLMVSALGACLLVVRSASAQDVKSNKTVSHWESVLAQRLPEYGHRNWIVIADSAFPAQTREGIETIVTHEDQLAVVKTVVEQFEKAKHVRPIVYVDRELTYVSESDAAGIEDYRKALSKVLGSRKPTAIPHEQIIAKLDKTGEMYKVLVLKTDMTLPYTSVFFELDCGYWSPSAETRLRNAMKAATK